MHYRLSRFVLIAALLGGLILSSLSTTNAQTGKTTTSEITIAGGAVAWFLTYESALLRSKGSVKQAEQVMDATTDTGSGPVSLNQVRGLIIVDVANAGTDKEPRWRDEFENFRFCWNRTLALDATTRDTSLLGGTKVAPANAPAPPAASANKRHTVSKTAQKAAPTAAPTAVPTVKPPEYPGPTCNGLVGNVLGNMILTKEPKEGSSLQDLNLQVDLRDLYTALATAPSLFSQVQKQEVGAHVLDDYLQARFLTIAGKSIVDLIVHPPTRAVKGEGGFKITSLITNGSVINFITNCLQLGSAVDCLDKVAEVEGSLEAVQKQRDACAWDRHAWMPSYTAIKLWANTKASATWRELAGHPESYFKTSPVDTDTYDTSGLKTAIDRVGTMDLGSPPGC
jgi:hypothetical protein